MKQGIRLSVERDRDPQTQGKVERFHLALQMARRRRWHNAEMDQGRGWAPVPRPEEPSPPARGARHANVRHALGS